MDQNATLITVVEQFKQELESRKVRVEKLILFGSHVNGNIHEGSDIDVVVISSDFSTMNYWERIDCLTEAVYQVGAPIEASAFTPEEWAAEKSLLIDYAKDGVSIP